MTEQLSLSGFEAAQPTDRLFFAIFPDKDSATRIAKLALDMRAELGLKGRPLLTDHFHITLHHMGDHVGLPPSVLAGADEAAANIAESSFAIAFDRVASFAGRARNKPFVLRGGDGVDAVIAFQQKLGMAMKRAGLGRWAESSFTPHVTLLYDDRSIAERVVNTVSWAPQEFVLVRSKLGQTQHIRLATWPLHR
jgi:RNA 2',3'-cyclic 3'-phosphodiesterase